MDHAAATPLHPRVKEVMEPYWTEHFGNPSAIHQEGVSARNAVEHARASIAQTLGCHSDEVVFAGSATESANLALIGAVRAWRRAHPDRIPEIIISEIEHAAVLSVADNLESEGVRVHRLPVDEEGVVSARRVTELLTTDTVVVSVMHANNEIGTIQPIEEIAKSIRLWKRDVRKVTRDVSPQDEDRYPLLHTDAAQTVGHLPIRIPKLGVDLLTFSGAKIGGPKGIGALIVLRGTQIDPVIVGGGHEGGRRAGTENVPLIVGLAESVVLAQEGALSESHRLSEIRDILQQGVLATVPGVIVNGSLTARLPHMVSFTIPGVDHEFLTLALDAKGIAVSTKSACNEWDAETSHVLLALRKASGSAHPASAIRVSLGVTSTKEHAEEFVRTLQLVMPLVMPSL